jgi:hypothetical protein
MVIMLVVPAAAYGLCAARWLAGVRFLRMVAGVVLVLLVAAVVEGCHWSGQ